MESKDYLSAIRAALVGIGAGLVLLVFGALIATRLASPDPFLTAVSYGALVVGAVICGFLQGRGGASLPGILLSAAVYALIPLTVSWVLGGFSRFFVRALVYLGMALIAGAVAWLIPSARPRRRYRY